MTRSPLHHRFRIACSALVCGLLLAARLAAQNRTPLRLGAVQPGTLGSDDRHTYTLALADSTFVFGYANQIPLDVVVTVLSPDGDEVAEFDDRVPWSPVDTPTNIGSVTKQFTGMSILLLENDGLLSLDDDVRKHIPEPPDFGATVTIRNLLNHASGCREIYNFLAMTGRDGEDFIRRGVAIRIVQRQPELQADPDTEYNCYNTGYILLSMILERISGKPFPEFVRERIFEPLAMTHTWTSASRTMIWSSTGCRRSR
jgi:CubicO group peptidase (beta-lactamase class C family)